MHTVGVDNKESLGSIKFVKFSSLFSLHFSSYVVPEIQQIVKRLCVELNLNTSTNVGRQRSSLEQLCIHSSDHKNPFL